MQLREQIDPGLVTFGNRAWRVSLDKTFTAEILDDEESRIKIGMTNGGRREGALAQTVGDGNKWLYVFGEMHRGAVGLSIIDGRTIGAARRVHQNDRRVAAKQPCIGTRRGIARHPLSLCLDQTGLLEKL